MAELAELETTLRLRRGLPAAEARRALREEAGASLSQVAAVCGVTPQAVFDWERGADPRGRNLVVYSKVLRMFEELA